MFPLVSDLSDHRWRDRVVVVFASPNVAARQRRILNGAGARERDLVVVRGTAGLRRKLRVPGGGPMVALVGKDGTLKATSRQPFAREWLFRLIDQMPMRRQEASGGRD